MTWVPLKSDPEMMNKYMISLGVSDDYRMIDVFGLEPDLLMMIPRPVVAVLLLFPMHKYEEHSKQQAAEIKEKGQEISDNIFYVKQTSSNSCGTIAIIHSIANNTDKISLSDGPLKQYLTEAKSCDADKRGQLLSENKEIFSKNQELRLEGEPEDTNVASFFHFVAFVHCNGGLYELDGRKSFPIRLGSTTPDTLLEDVATICKEYISRNPDNLLFSVMALAPKDIDLMLQD